MAAAEPDFQRARYLAALGRTAEAREALAAVRAGVPDHLGALLLEASLLQEERQDDGALLLCRRAAAAWPLAAEALNALARCLHALGRHEEALARARDAQAVLGEEDNVLQTAPVYLTLVWCLRELRRYQEALSAAEEGLSRVADGVLAHWASVVEEELARSERQRC
jgi:tetratricopeptide (TPR) repeat protein